MKKHNKQVILFKTIESNLPEVGIFETFDDGIEEVYIPANDDVEQIENIAWWMEIPKN